MITINPIVIIKPYLNKETFIEVGGILADISIVALLILFNASVGVGCLSITVSNVVKVYIVAKHFRLRKDTDLHLLKNIQEKEDAIITLKLELYKLRASKL